ncbi:hypothetical protein ACFVYE_32710 [Streptomyces sp. NPDC058239]|uniref:hypothetical protein n=1 Tax=Streptomyces sp. NPDC058239 TaxID=3346395 RepID=UPI0036E32C0B
MDVRTLDTDAPTNTGTKEEYDAREDRRSQEQEAARAVEDQRRREELARLESRLGVSVLPDGCRAQHRGPGRVPPP